MYFNTNNLSTHQALPRDAHLSFSFPLRRNDLFALKQGGFILSGTATLASGTVTVSDRRIQPSSVAIVSYKTPAGTLGTNLKGLTAAGSLAITAVATDRSTVTTDTSAVSYLIIL